MTPAGLPHSEIRGSMDACSSPRLFAACHVLLRLPAPRHPPCALTALDQFPPLVADRVNPCLEPSSESKPHAHPRNRASAISWGPGPPPASHLSRSRCYPALTSLHPNCQITAGALLSRRAGQDNKTAPRPSRTGSASPVGSRIARSTRKLTNSHNVSTGSVRVLSAR